MRSVTIRDVVRGGGGEELDTMASEEGDAVMAAPTFGELLRRGRRAAGLTQEELAARAGLSARGIADLERGARRTPRRDTVALLVRALGGSPADEAALTAAARRRPAPPPPTTLPPADDASPPPPPGAHPAVGGDQQRAASPNQPHHNLPAQLTPLLGRDSAVRAAVALLRRADVRLVTLTGPGGIGKTRLAIQVGAELLDDYADGVWFVRLSRLTDPGLVVPTIAESLGLREAGGQSLAETLRLHLRERRLLLVLDNCEHIAAAMPEVSALLESAPALKVLATSRASLHLHGEHEHPVSPLGLPPTAAGPDLSHTPERLLAYPAAALFVARARAARPDFALTAANAAAIAAICARLDGLPLAIELAAARVKVLPPGALLARLERGLALLVGGAHAVAERQQAMRDTIAWSENLLSAEQRVLFRRLAVFAGGCTLEAAEAVCATPLDAAPLGITVLDGLSALVDQSLVRQREEDGEPRFDLLHVIREHAQDGLVASGEEEALRRAHAAHMLAFAERAEPELIRPSAPAWLERLEREHDNLRAALGWAQDRAEVDTGLRLVAAIFRFWMVRGHLREGRAWMERLLALNPCPAGEQTPDAAARWSRVQARALFAAGVLALYLGDLTAAGGWLEPAVAQAQAAGDSRTAASALNSLGIMSQNQGELELAGSRLEECLALMRTVGEPRGIGMALGNLGIVHYMQGNLARAEAAFTEALALARQAGDRDLEATTLANLASVALARADVAQGESLGREALALYWALADPRRCAVGLEGLAGSAGMAGLGERAARLLGAAASLRAVLGAPAPVSERDDVERQVAAARAALGEPVWAAAFAAGQSLPLEAAVAEALGEIPND